MEKQPEDNSYELVRSIHLHESSYTDWVYGQVAHKIRTQIFSIIAAIGAAIAALLIAITSYTIDGFKNDLSIKIGIETEAKLIPQVNSALGTILIGSPEILETLKKKAEEEVTKTASTTVDVSLANYLDSEDGQKQLRDILRTHLDSNQMTALLTEMAKKIMAAQITERIETKGEASNTDNSQGLSQEENSSDSQLSALLQAIGGDNSEIMLLAKAKEHLEAGEYEQARAAALEGKALDKDKNESVYDVIIAQSYYEAEQYKEAIAAFKVAISLEPEYSATHNNLGSAYFGLSTQQDNETEKEASLSQALAATEEALRLEPGAADVVVNMSVVLNAMGRYDEALSSLRQLADSGSDDILYQTSATLAVMEGNEDEAVELLTTVVERSDHYALQAAADDDFASLRENEKFTALLESALPGLMDAVRAAWASPD